MIFDDCFQVLSVFCPTELVVLHDQLDQSLILLDTIHDWLEIALELITRQVDLSEFVIVTDQGFSNDICRLVPHTLVSEGKAILSLGQSHLSNESLLLLIRLAW